MTGRERYTPTPEQIAEECRKIREGWSEDRWARQSIQAEREWNPPVMKSGKLPPHD